MSKCDICGQVGVAAKSFGYSVFDDNAMTIDRADLCPVCKTEIIRYVKELKQRVKRAKA